MYYAIAGGLLVYICMSEDRRPWAYCALLLFAFLGYLTTGV